MFADILCTVIEYLCELIKRSEEDLFSVLFLVIIEHVPPITTFLPPVNPHRPLPLINQAFRKRNPYYRMTQTCSECDGFTTWDDDVGSAVCTSCGTLTDPSQSVLTSQFGFPEDDNRYGSSSGLGKRARFSNWALADQGKEARDKRNLIAMTGFMDSLARSFNATGLSSRAMNIFHKAKETIHFRWGRSAKLVAGACLAVALRESNRPDCLRDISFLLSEPFPALSRAFISVTSAINIVLDHVETASYIPILHQHMSSLQTFPTPLRQELSSISFPAVTKTATYLSDILARTGTLSTIKGPLPSIACAVFIISIESELRSTTKCLSPLAQVLGNRLNVGKGAVMTFYKAIQNTLASLAENVPWLDKYESKNGRARVAKRNVVARATKDIVVFYNDSWKQTEKPNLDIICENDTRFLDQDRSTGDRDCVYLRKKRKTQLEVGMQFLLDPVAGPLPGFQPSSIDTAKPLMLPQSVSSLLIYCLSAPMPSKRPTRLQLLAAARGGADEISDSELFEENEIESLLRNEEEIKMMAHLYDWNVDTETTSDSETALDFVSQTSKTSQYTCRDGSTTQESRKRINLDALARFLNDENVQGGQPSTGLLGIAYDSDAVDSVDSESEFGDNVPDEFQLGPLASNSRVFPDEELVLEDWRPVSPGCGTIVGDDRYEESYD